MAINCVRWEDRPAGAACTGWGESSRPEADWCPDDHGNEGCEDWEDIDFTESAEVVFVTDDSDENQVVMAATGEAVIRTTAGGRIPQ